MDIKPGQIWKENHASRERYVRILEVQLVEETRRDGKIYAVQCITVERDGDQWRNKPGCGRSFIDIIRFNGKSGGYSLFEDVKVNV